MRREVVDTKSALAEQTAAEERKTAALAEADAKVADAESVKTELRELVETAEMRLLDQMGERDAALQALAAALGEPTVR